MTKTEQALSDLKTLQRMTVQALLAYASRNGLAGDDVLSSAKDRDPGGMAHRIVRKAYGEKVYRAAWRKLMGFN